jgi:ATP/maltotriose-dependent transcriptional regulator MalT/DNA-binding SARP family transcriptional activator
MFKISRPATKDIYPRNRLFKHLEKMRQSPVIWVSSPAGSGKTFLISSYIEHLGIPCIWYQLDKGDADIATFFYYLGQAVMKTAPSKRKSLPLLTPEYLQGGESTFTLRYFEELYRRLKPPFFIVFDNYQDVPLKSPFHEVMLSVLSHIPEGVNVIVISRGDIPDTLIRLKAHGCINSLHWEEIRFTEEESREIIISRTKNLCSEETTQHLYTLSDGWIAGLILLSEAIKKEKAEPRFQEKYTFEEIFTYFAQEIFEHLDQKTQDFFLATALLPKMTVRMAEELTGDNTSGDMLHAMNRNNYFTAKQISSGNAYYEYHPLYREFLLSRARTMLPPQTLTSLHRRAAILLEKEGQTESAISLLKDIADWEGMIGIIMFHAPEMLKQGRHVPLQEWLDSLPAKVLEPDPWLSYWKGMSLLPFSPLCAKNFCEQAFAGFQSANHLMGSILAASGVLNAIAYGYDDCKAFEYWYAILNDLAAGIEKFPDEEGEALLIASMVVAIRGGDISHPDAEIWGERALAIKETSTTINSKIQALCYLFWHQLNNKGVNDVLPLFRLLQRLSRSRHAQSASKIIICFAEVMYHGMSGRHDELLGAVKKGLELSETTGIHIMDMWFHSALPISFLNVMDHKNAYVCFDKVESLVESWPKLTQCLHNGQVARAALIRNDLHEAIHYGKMALDLAQVTGSKYSLAASQLILASICHRLMRHDEALQHLENGHRYAEATNNRSLLIMSLLIKAQVSFDSGEETRGMQLLHYSLILAREGGYVYAVLDDPFITVHMCEKALAAGIEIEYVQEIIRRRGLIPDKPPLHIENWPWALKIHTLGRFEVIVNGTSSQFELKSQKKPLQLLKALIALGGNEVRGDEIADILWPDAEGDMAHHSFENILYRLRKLLGCHEALQLKEGRLTLDPCHCWVDTRAFERLLRQADELNQQGQKGCSLDLMEKAAELYRGDFLAADIKESWPKPLAERLKIKNLKNILRISDYLAADGQWERAAGYYEQYLQSTQGSEDIYRKLMLCYKKLGRHSEAVLIYQQCRKALSTALGTAPSPETEAIYRSLLSDR